MRRYARLLEYLKPYRWAFIGSVAATSFASVLDGFTFALLIPLLRVLFDVGAAVPDAPTVVERVIDMAVGSWILSDSNIASLRNIVLVILGATAAKNVGVVTAVYLGAHVQECATRDLRRQFFVHLQGMSLGFFQRTKSGQLVSRMLSDVDQASLFFSQMLRTVVRQGVMVIVYVAILFSLSWRLTLLTLVVAPVIALIFKPILAGVRRQFAVAVESRGELSAQLNETLRGAREVKTYAAEGYERRRFGAALDRFVRSTLRAHRLAALPSPLSETLATMVFVILLLAGSWLTLGGQAVRPELVIAYLVVALRLLSPVKHVVQFPAFGEQALAGASRVFEILDRPLDDVDTPPVRTFPGLRDTIEFRDVWFAYRESDWVLRGVNLTVRRGQVVAIVGASGTGKSTLVDLLPRFIDPTRGEVLLDGVPTTAYGRQSLRSVLGVVAQETIIFNDSVHANIAYGEAVGRDAVVEAAKAAHAHEFIGQLPQGYDTRIGERGTLLSGGERQRIAVARALLRDPPILILDEATSALDSTSERQVQQAITRLMQNRTVLVVAHRLSTVLGADSIAVLDDGLVGEWGRHQDLVTAGGRYQELYDGEWLRTGYDAP
ncbi:MAG: ABC transporter ATP-binding protein [Gemmatimonadetes bacterium]|nr:ABC transporter ATP-binding protein [Gemmatimonadota bacterium]